MSDEAGVGHNSKKQEEVIAEAAKRMIEIAQARKELNREAADVRQKLVDNDVDKEAFRDVLSYHTKKRYEREGYDENHKLCMRVLNSAENLDMFAEAA